MLGLSTIKLALIGAAVGITAIGLWTRYVNDRAYDRAVSDTKAEMREVIRKQREQVKADVERLRNMTPTEIDVELWKRCMRSATEDVCGPRP